MSLAQPATRGYTRVTFGIPDVLVHYHAAASRRIDVGLLARERAACHGEACGARAFDNEAATLVVDIVDSRTEELLWRGWAEGDISGLIDNQSWLEERIGQAVARILERLPRGV